jgi:AcrR family transcriptional regulator
LDAILPLASYGDRVTGRPYHHGDLRRALLVAAVSGIEESGPAAFSLRDLARRAGVSHAAPAHHFGDKAGLLTALAIEGYQGLADALAAARERTGELLEIGVAYVRFAVEHRAHFEVMFRPDLYHREDPKLRAARDRAGESLRAGLSALSRPPGGERAEPIGRTGVAAWSIVHGFAALWVSGVLPPDLGDDPATAARSVIRLLFESAD